MDLFAFLEKSGSHRTTGGGRVSSAPRRISFSPRSRSSWASTTIRRSRRRSHSSMPSVPGISITRDNMVIEWGTIDDKFVGKARNRHHRHSRRREADCPSGRSGSKTEKSPPYYPIHEDAAKRAKDMNSFYEYERGSGSLLAMHSTQRSTWSESSP